MNAVRMDDHTGKTWAEIVGETSKMRIATSDTDTDEVEVASIAGMTATDVHPTDLTAMGGVGGTDTYADGTQTADPDSDADSMYKGIMGTAICAGSDCKVEEDKLTGSWYFTPAEPKWLLREGRG